MGTIMHMSDSDPGVGVLALTGVGFNNRIVLCSRKCMSTHKHTEKLVKWVQNTAGWSGSNEGGGGGGGEYVLWKIIPKQNQRLYLLTCMGRTARIALCPPPWLQKSSTVKGFPFLLDTIARYFE